MTALFASMAAMREKAKIMPDSRGISPGSLDFWQRGLFDRDVILLVEIKACKSD